MTVATMWPWAALLLLGTVHGLNPGMGWLFAVGVGIQENSRRAVWRAMVPLAAGHALAILAAIGLALALGLVVPPATLKIVLGAILIIWSACAVAFQFHPRLGGRVRRRELVRWSFLMASAHGAGVMAVPAALRLANPDVLAIATAHAGVTVDHAAHLADVQGVAPPSAARSGMLVTLFHSGAYVVAMAVAAVLVFEFVGLRVLRSAWINLEMIWAATLAITGLLTALV